MFVFRRPNDEYLRHFLLDQRTKPFSYIEVGSTRAKRIKKDCAELLAAGYDVDHYRVLLGVGASCYDAAVQAVRDWKMHRFASWLELIFPDVSIAVGETVAVRFILHSILS